MPAEVMNHLANQLPRRLDKARLQKLVRLMGLVDRARAENQRRTQRLDKRRFGAVVHHVGLRAKQFLDHLHQLMVRRALVAGDRRMQLRDRQAARPAFADRGQRLAQQTIKIV